jgi:hypothetical protein
LLTSSFALNAILHESNRIATRWLAAEQRCAVGIVAANAVMGISDITTRSLYNSHAPFARWDR